MLISMIKWHPVIRACLTLTANLELNSDASLVPLKDKKIAAVNVSLHTWEKTSRYVFAFLPIKNWVDLKEVCSSQALNTPDFEALYCPYNSSRGNESDRISISSTHPNFTKFWVDRSAVVFNLVSVNLPDTNPCLKMSVCGVNRYEDKTESLFGSPHGVHKYSGEVPCHRQFGYFSTHCMKSASDHSASSSIFLVSQTLVVSVLPTVPSNTYVNASVSFVASIGILLKHGEFACPSGMFLCPPAPRCFMPDTSGSCYGERVCLPSSLRCDRHVNCPGTSWDEDNCPATPVTMSWQFPGDRQQAVDREQAIMKETLMSMTADQLLLAGYRYAPSRHHTSSVSISLAIVFVLLGIFLAGLLLFACMYRRRAKFRQVDERCGDRSGGGVKRFWPSRVGQREAIVCATDLDTQDGGDVNSCLLTSPSPVSAT